MGEFARTRFAATFPVSPPPAFIHARRTVHPKCFCPFLGVNRPGCALTDPDHASSFFPPTQFSKKPPPPEIPGSGRCRSPFQAVFSVERPVAGSVKKIIVVAPAALGIHPGSSVFRRQPARLRPSPIRITPRRSLFPKTATRSRHRN